MTNASTVVASLRGLEARTLRSAVAQSRKSEETNEDATARLAVSALKDGDANHVVDGNSSDEDAALAREEENLMLEGDEEISSHDESGAPIVDTQKLENRMLTVAIVKSVVDTGGEPQQHRYGLRKRRRPSEKASMDSPRSPGGRSTRSKSTDSPRPPNERVTRSSPAVSPRTTRSSVKIKREGGEEAAAPALQAETPVSNPLATKTEMNPAESNKAVHCTTVPNPLANSTPSPVENMPASAVIKVEPRESAGNSSVPTAPAVACPLPVPSSQVAQPEHVASAATEARGPRGRIFSIDIDPAGLDFPDLGIVGTMNQQSELSRTPPLPPISATVSGGGQAVVAPNVSRVPQDKSVGLSVEQQPKHPGAPDANTDLIIVGRDRAMSFEFFSFGLNHDEPLPPAPDQTGGTEFVGRPRGDSIIFDPCSFRDGGLLEENGWLKSRGNSIDVAVNEEVAIMNEPGFAPAPTSLTHVESRAHPGTHVQVHRSEHAVAGNNSYILPSRNANSQMQQPLNTTLAKSPSAAQMATLPSSLSGSSMSHSTFQMELLNKDGRIGIYLPEARKERIAKFHSKRKMRIWRKRIKYDCRKKLADSRPRIKGRFVKRSDMEEDED